MSDKDTDNDLPLLANVNDILVNHYIFNFVCDFNSKQFSCLATLLLKPTCTMNVNCSCESCSYVPSSTEFDTANVNNPEIDLQGSKFVVVLDCHQIDVFNVAGLKLSEAQLENLKFKNISILDEGQLMCFSIHKWCLKIWSNGDSCVKCFPNVLKISYRTRQSCPSLLWVKDQEGNPSVFSFGAAINNRSLFPCQEPPVAMATWEATVTVTDLSIVLMTGDTEPAVTHDKDVKTFYYYTHKALPLSTLSLAIGQWKKYSLNSRKPRCCLYSCPSLLEKSIEEFSEYIPKCIQACEDYLGPYPFPRIDFLMVPPTFSSLGMASPNLVFLSQSLLSGDHSLLSRLSHEVSHGWFGLSLGALDWTEEWLSEGFATFVEDVVHLKAMNMSEVEGRWWKELKSHIRRKILLDEIQNTSEQLQLLRPSFGEIHEDTVDGVNAVVLKESRHPLKSFVQIHYIKGYFLLNHLCGVVGLDNFMNFLKTYVFKFEGCLVTSREFLDLFFETFPRSKTKITTDNIYDNWLHSTHIVPEILNLKPSFDNELYKEKIIETKKWKERNSLYLNKKNKKRKIDLDHMKQLSSEQLLLLLEDLLEESKLSGYLMKDLNKVFQFENANAEVQHRWFELVVKHHYKCQYTALQDFITNHLALGVYLYNEMIHGEEKSLRRIALECYAGLKEELEPNFKSLIEEMIQNSLVD